MLLAPTIPFTETCILHALLSSIRVHAKLLCVQSAFARQAASFHHDTIEIDSIAQVAQE